MPTTPRSGGFNASLLQAKLADADLDEAAKPEGAVPANRTDTGLFEATKPEHTVHAGGEVGTVTGSGAVVKVPAFAEKLEQLAQKSRRLGPVMKKVNAHIRKGEIKEAASLLKTVIGFRLSWKDCGVYAGDSKNDGVQDALLNQLNFMQRMKEAGIKGASYPPTENQLLRMFTSRGVKGNPTKALELYRAYASAFHVHPKLGGIPDIEYQKSGGVPEQNGWDHVTGKRVRAASGKCAGRYQNDCEGFAYIADRLLGKDGAGLDTSFVGLAGGGTSGHAVLRVKHGGTYWVASNDKVHGPDSHPKSLYAQAWQKDADGAGAPTRVSVGKTQEKAYKPFRGSDSSAKPATPSPTPPAVEPKQPEPKRTPRRTALDGLFE
ncbi:hypothetical protein ACFL59_16595 [Planctomycetota bacterium]